MTELNIQLQTGKETEEDLRTSLSQAEGKLVLSKIVWTKECARREWREEEGNFFEMGQLLVIVFWFLLLYTQS